MSFQPVIPFGGFAGWAFLKRTMTTQQNAFNQSADIDRKAEYFRENASGISSSEALLADRSMLSFALDAFGLGDDINNKYFIQKVLDDGILDSGALANKLSDKRYHEFSKAFGFGDFDTPNTILSTFPDEIISRFQKTQFEVAIGEQDENMRLALNFEREISKITDIETSADGRWYSVLGNPAVRAIFEKAFDLPSSIGRIDLDQQLAAFREKTGRHFESPEIEAFTDATNREKLVRLFFLKSELSSYPAGNSSAQNALTLLSPQL